MLFNGMPKELLGKIVQVVKLKENDFVEQLFIASTHDYMLFFTSKGKVCLLYTSLYLAMPVRLN